MVQSKQIQKIPMQQEITKQEIEQYTKKGTKVLLLKTMGKENLTKGAKTLAKQNHLRIIDIGPYATQSTAEWVYFMLHLLTRRTKEIAGLYNLQIDPLIRGKEKWRQGTQIANKTMLIIGKGNIGTAIGKIAHGYRIKTQYYDPIKIKQQKQEGITKHLQKADIIVMACPLNKNTENYFKQKDIEEMKQRPYIINPIRTKLLNLDIIEWALAQEKISGYAADETTKHRVEHHSKCMTTPQIAAYTKEAKEQKTREIRKKTKHLKEYTR